jgi:hypothetical protein
MHLRTQRLAKHNENRIFMYRTAETFITLSLITMLMGTYALIRGREDKEDNYKEV